MQTAYQIRWAKITDWTPAMKMIWRTFMDFDSKDYTQEGVKNFFDFISDGELYEAFVRGDYQMMIALDGERVIGAGTIRNRNYLSLLFVDGNYHYQGIGKAIIDEICTYLKEEAGERYISVKASPYAVRFYQKLGFRQISPEEKYSGIRVTPMQKIFI